MKNLWKHYAKLKTYQYRNTYNFAGRGDLGLAHLFYLERVSLLETIK